VNWSGDADSKGFITGFGILQWFIDGKAGERFEGTMLKGKAQGTGTLVLSSGIRYEGDWING
jgi:hypothetical protein